MLYTFSHKVLVVSVNTHLKKNLYENLDEITVTLDAEAFMNRVTKFITPCSEGSQDWMHLGVDYLKWNTGWRFACQRLFLRFYTQVNGWDNLTYMLWYFFSKAEIVQAAPYHINLNDTKSDFNTSLEIRTSGNTEGFNHESVMTFDAGVYILASIRILAPYGGFVDFLIHGDKQIIKVYFVNPLPEGTKEAAQFRKQIMEDFLAKVQSIRRKTCCHLKPNDTIISKSCFIFHKTIYINGIGVFPVIKTLSSLNFKRADEPLTLESCVKNITAGIMDLSTVARTIEGLGFMKGSEIALAYTHYFTTPTASLVQKILSDVAAEKIIRGESFITTPAALEELEPINNEPPSLPRTCKVMIPIYNLRIVDLIHISCFSYGILTPDVFPTDNAPLSNTFMSAARETASEAYHDLRILKVYVDSKYHSYLDALGYIPLVSKVDPESGLNAWSGINYPRPINKTSLLNKTLKCNMRCNIVGNSDILEIIDHLEDRNETTYNFYTPEEIYPKINVTLYKAFPMTRGKKIISGIEKTTTFRKMAKGYAKTDSTLDGVSLWKFYSSLSPKV